MIESLPAWGVRVEIRSARRLSDGAASLPAWGVRVEISLVISIPTGTKSLPAWGVRVEIPVYRALRKLSWVTPRMGSAG